MSFTLLGKSVKAILIILIFSVAQIIVLLFSLSRVVSYKTQRLESGLPPSFIERVFEFISNIFFFPLNFFQEVLPLASVGGPWGYILLGINSLLWGLFFYHVYVFISPRNT